MNKLSLRLALVVLASAVSLCFTGTPYAAESKAAESKEDSTKSKEETTKEGTTNKETTIEALIERGQYYRFNREQAVKSELDVQITPLLTTLRKSQSKGYDDVERPVLVLPVKIANKSQQAIEAYIAHEWHGGIWPSTDLHVVMLRDKDSTRRIQPVYLLGPKPANKATVLRAGESIVLDLRMDWPGTGSIYRRPLMSTPKSAFAPSAKSVSYGLCMILFFKGKEKNEYVISPKMQIEVSP